MRSHFSRKNEIVASKENIQNEKEEKKIRNNFLRKHFAQKCGFARKKVF